MKCIPLIVFVLSLIACQSPAIREPDYEEIIEEPMAQSDQDPDSLTPSIELYGVFYQSAQDSDTVYIPNGRITLIDEGFSREVDYDSFGYYELSMLFGREYSIRYSAPDHYTKFIEIDTRFIPDSVIGAGILMPTDMTLGLAENPQVEELLENNPIGKAYYRAETNDLGWDFEHTDSIKSILDSLEHR